VAIAGDPCGDGMADVRVGACGAGGRGAAALFTTHGGERVISDADALFEGAAAGDEAGFAVAGAGDIDGDGLDDVLVGAPGASLGAGRAYLLLGSELAATWAPAAELTGAGAGDAAGASVSAAGDVDGTNTYGDVAIGAPLTDRAGADAGTAYVLFGPLEGVVELDTALAQLDGIAAYGHAGASVAGRPGDGTFDADSDGFSDVLVGAPYYDGQAPDGGAAFLLTFGH
jgi:hypothetical protein